MAPYNQVFQQLLESDSLLGDNDAGVNLVLLRGEDIADNVDAFIDALRSFMRRSRAPMVIGLCPPSSALLDDAAQGALSRLARVPGIGMLDLSEGLSRFHVEEVNDPYTDELGHIPYTRAAFCAMAATLVRFLFTLGSPYRAIIVDPHDVLWREGEAPPAMSDRTTHNALFGGPKSSRFPAASTVVVDPPHADVQRILAEQAAQGLKLCLSTHGEERDIFYHLKAGAHLKPRHIQSWRIDDGDAGAHVFGLAGELQLPTSAIVFVSANEARCAQVRKLAPETLVIELTPNGFDNADLLAGNWALSASAASQGSPVSAQKRSVVPR